MGVELIGFKSDSKSDSHFPSTSVTSDETLPSGFKISSGIFFRRSWPTPIFPISFQTWFGISTVVHLFQLVFDVYIVFLHAVKPLSGGDENMS